MVCVTVEAGYSGRRAVGTPDTLRLSEGEGNKYVTNLPPLDVRSTCMEAVPRLEGEQHAVPSPNKTLDSSEGNGACGDLEEYHGHNSEVGLPRSSANGGFQQHNISLSVAEMQKTLALLTKAEEFLKLGSQRNVVLILWNRASDRKVFTKYIDGYNMEGPLKVGETYSGEFVLEEGGDPSGRNISNSLIEIFVNTDTNTSFCVHNISNKSRRISHEIAAVYFLKRILNSARKIKIILSISYPSGIKDLNKEDFLNLVTQSAMLISNVAKFKQSIALIVSEENQTGEEGSVHEVVNDVVKFLEGTKRFISENYQLDDASAGEKINRESAVQLIDALLMNNSNGYARIGLLRETDAGSGSEGKEMDTQTIIHDHTTFVEHENDDFRFILSQELRNEIQVLANYTNAVIRSRMVLVGRDILEFYRSRKVQTSDIDTLLHQLQQACDVLSDMTRNISQSPEPKTLTTTLVNTLKTLEVNIVIDNLIDIAHQCKYLEILQIVTGDDSALTQTTEWLGPIRKIMNEIRESKDWFTFLVGMREKLLEPTAPAITLGNRRGARSVWAMNSSRKFLTEIESYGNITLSGIDGVKLEALRRVLRTTEREKTTISCLAGEAVLAKGAYVALSDVLLYKCSSKVKSIEIFASDEVLIDADILKVGEEMQVRILAPRWRIKGHRIIYLYGASGPRQKPQRANDGRQPGYRGQDGKPGLPGGDAGSYFGICREFIEGKIVIHNPDGGMGGPGQDGGNGAEGRRGDDPGIPSSREHCDLTKTDVWFRYRRTRFKKKKWRWSCFCFYDFYEYELYGSRGGMGGSGGHGGEGGPGGMGGQRKHIKLHDERGSWDVVGRNGKKGEDGKGGRGGEGGWNGNTVTAQCNSDWYIFFSKYRWKRAKCKGAGRGSRGQDGIRGGNKQLMRQAPESNGFKGELSSVINRYKEYLISSLDDTINKKSLIQFIMLLGSDLRVQSTYDAVALVNEMQMLENRFYERRNDVDFLPLYQSLLQRVTRYAASRKPGENSAQYKKVLSYLYTAILGKIQALRQSSECSLVTNMDGYLDSTLEYVRKVEKISKLDAITRISNDYKDKINEKIISANDFISREILPEIETIGNETEATIDSLISEIIEMRKNVREEEEALRKKQKELENSLFYKITSGIVNFISGALSVLNPAAQTAEHLIGRVKSVSESLALRRRGSGWTSINLPQPAWSILQQQFDVVRSITNTTITAFRYQLNAVFRAVREYPMHLGDMEKTVKDIEGKLNNVGQFEVEEVRKLRDALMKEINMKEEALKILHNRHKRDIGLTKRSSMTGALKALQTLIKSDKVNEIISEIYVKYNDMNDALDEIDRSIKEAHNRFEELNKFEDKIHSDLLPMIRVIELDLLRVQSHLASKSRVTLRVASWKVQTTLKDVKLHLRQFTEGMKVKEIFARCIEKLDDVMTTLIDIYDRIQSYTEQKELADYIADIASADSDNVHIPDRNLRGAISTLEKIISINILFGQYEKTVAAFKQWVFPFAELWLQNFNLLPYRMTNDSYEGFVFLVTRQIHTLKSKLTEYKTTIMRGVHSHIHNAEFSSDYKSGQPFYVWDNKRHKNTILDLLAGKEVVVKADILYGVRKNAVKFNRIEINFKSVYKGIQDELDKLLFHFHVKLTHHGNSHYKCGNNFYVIRGDNQTIEYSREKRQDGQPMDHNSVYTRLRNGDILLSPYAMWSIRLVNVTNVNFPQLQPFGNFVDLELVGEGQYVSQGADVCNQDLRKYYEVDESFSEFDRIV
jgi:hypothetical protein